MELLERLSLLRSRQQNPQGLTNEQVQQLQHAITETAVSSPPYFSSRHYPYLTTLKRTKRNVDEKTEAG
jgi:hypothetical protein